MFQLKLLLALSLIWWGSNIEDAIAAPQSSLINTECSKFNASNLRNFFENINRTFSDLRGEVSNQSKHFVTTQKARGEVLTYAMFQCRNYLSKNECLSCFDVASTQIRNCSAANGARVIYDGCFLRYESDRFYFQTNELGSGVSCGNTSSSVTGFRVAGQQTLKELQTATPKTKDFYATTKTQVAGGSAIYAIAQCVETATETNCLNCMQIGYYNLQSCLPYTEGRAYDAGCFMRYSTTPFFPDNQINIHITPYLKQGGSSKWAVIGGVVGAVVVVLLLLALFARRWSRKQNFRGDILGATALKVPVYKYNDLKAATKNFSHENKLGSGGYADVYKGTLREGKVVAIKKLKVDKIKEMEDDFKGEVKLMNNLHHRNLVRLLGYCSEGEERILVYEYMANNSLERLLFGNEKRSLNWKKRYDIILGTAMGLAYLHEELDMLVVHSDIKPANILLDENFQPKIADFGLARILPEDHSQLHTRVGGTRGYIAPEYQLSEKADTYSYGVVVLEIISGQKCTYEKQHEDGHGNLLYRAWKLYERGRHLDLVDNAIDKNDHDEVGKIIEIALLCSQELTARPKMSEVVDFLKRKSLPNYRQLATPTYCQS